MKHHEASIPNMIEHFQGMPGIIGLFLNGSVATGTEHEKSDLDGVAVVTEEFYQQKEKIGKTCESIWGKCTYEGGYFDVHYKTKAQLLAIADKGSEPMRNMFSCARTLFTYDAQLPKLISRIPIFQQSEKEEKQLRYYSTFKQSYVDYLVICKPVGFARLQTASRLIFCLYRLILLENGALFPSIRKLEQTVAAQPNKPPQIMEKCAKFMETLSDEDAGELIKSYESWTSYQFPTDFQFISNHCVDPYEN